MLLVDSSFLDQCCKVSLGVEKINDQLLSVNMIKTCNENLTTSSPSLSLSLPLPTQVYDLSKKQDLDNLRMIETHVQSIDGGKTVSLSPSLSMVLSSR